MKNNRDLIIILIVILLECSASTFIGPIMPTIIKQLNLPDYTFGTAYSIMSFACLLSALAWGEIANKIGRVKTFIVGILGYAACQFCFMFATTEIQVLLARGASGIFIAAINCIELLYIIDISTPETKGRNILYLSTVTSISAALGYLVGGLAGEISVKTTFIVQLVVLVLAAIICIFFVEEKYVPAKTDKKSKVKVKIEFNKLLILLLVIEFISYTTYVVFDESVNYFIKDVFLYTSSINGILKAVVAIIIFICNIVICRKIMNSHHFSMVYKLIFLMIAIVTTIEGLVNNRVIFFAIYFVFYGLHALELSMTQFMITSNSSKENNARITSIYNLVRSCGQILGGMLAGGLYMISSTLCFSVVGIMLLFAFGLSMISVKKSI